MHVVGQLVYLALRSPLGALDDDPDLRRTEQSGYMDAADALYDFLQRFQQRLRERRPRRVAFLHTRRYGNWAYGEAFRRASLESAVMIASRAASIPYSLVRQEDVAAKLSLPMRNAKDLAVAAARLHPGKPLYWAERSLAYAAAVTAAVLDEAQA